MQDQAVFHVNDQNFAKEVLESPLPVVVDFWAEWCTPCLALSPVLDAVAEESKGRFRIAKVDVDKNPETPQKYGVRGIPTLVFFQDGQAKATKVGSLEKPQLVAWLESLL